MGIVENVLRSKRMKMNRDICVTLSSLPEFSDLNFTDIGAAGELNPRWISISNFLNYNGFEPDLRSSVIQQNPYKSFMIFPTAVSEFTGEIDIYLTSKPEVSSTFEPNFEILRKFPNPERFQVQEIVRVTSTRLDDLYEFSSDFIKLDIQGGEFSALKGGVDTLANVLGIEIEIEFLEIYKSQPNYIEISSYLRSLGFEYSDMITQYRWERGSKNNLGELVFGDFLFLRTPEFVLSKEFEVKVLSKYLAILVVYKRFDLINATLNLMPQDKFHLFREFMTHVEMQSKKFERNQAKVSLINFYLRKLHPTYRLYLSY
jgi:FkbM family methyltransferase